MKKQLVLVGLMAVGAACLPMAYADDSGADHHFVKDSVITTKVKTKLMAKHMSTLAHVKVDTDANGVVWLSGTAPTKDARDLAGMIAEQTDGVQSVKNNVEVVPH
ncbi:MAG TPA: BON domain-containing protein [Steroidobacteraceae bacterium]|jgi:hyperosmotically inducible protein|nr:BON domain-containing protein [Steroidobacteraceae bacterium]